LRGGRRIADHGRDDSRGSDGRRSGGCRTPAVRSATDANPESWSHS
jgi:hypothetical protein